MYTLSILTLAAAIVSEITFWIIRRDWKFAKTVIALVIVSALVYIGAFLVSADISSFSISSIVLYLLTVFAIHVTVAIIYLKIDRISTVTFIIFAPLATLFAGYLVIGPIEPPGFVLGIIDYFTTRFSIGSLRIQDFEILFFLISGSIYLTSPGNSLIRALLESKGCSVSKTELGIGAIIGILERLLIFALVLMGGLAAIAFVLAAKTAVRFKKLEDDTFAEYFLMGTLTSVAIALFTGLFFKYVLLPFI